MDPSIATLQYRESNVFASKQESERWSSKLAIQNLVEHVLFMAAGDLANELRQNNLRGLSVLQWWFREQGVLEASVQKLVQLCDIVYLEAQPCPRH